MYRLFERSEAAPKAPQMLRSMYRLFERSEAAPKAPQMSRRN
jgi:hypothetical protein